MQKQFSTIDEKIKFYQGELLKFSLRKMDLRDPTFLQLLFGSKKAREEKLKRYDNCIEFLKQEIIELRIQKHEFYSRIIVEHPVSHN